MSESQQNELAPQAKKVILAIQSRLPSGNIRMILLLKEVADLAQTLVLIVPFLYKVHGELRIYLVNFQYQLMVK